MESPCSKRGIWYTGCAKMRHVECCHTPKREPLSHASTRKGRCGSTWAQQIGAFALKGVALHYYAHHIGDFIRDTSRLSDPQAMAYLRLIWLYYETERPLPDDRPVLALRIGSDVETVGALLNAYFSYENGFWYHKRIESEIRKFSEKQDRAKLANAARWSKTHLKSEQLSDADQNVNRSQPITNNQEPITNNQEPETKNQNPKKKARKRVAERPADVVDGVWDDFLELRESQRAPVTETAITMIRNQASKAGVTLESALKKCCERGWRGFKAEWIKGDDVIEANPHLSQLGAATSINAAAAAERMFGNAT